MRQYKIGDRLIHKIDGRTVEFRGYAEHDLDGAYVYPLYGYGNELYVSVKSLTGAAQ
jgi:hypothetical protein